MVLVTPAPRPKKNDLKRNMIDINDQIGRIPVTDLLLFQVKMMD